jgi:hypothetical protein
MTANEDFLGLDDPAEKALARPPAFVVGAPLGDAQMKAEEAMYLQGLRDPQFVGATEPLFVTESDDGIEELPIGQAVLWHEIMRWPANARPPTIAEIEQFKAARDIALHRAHWDRLRAAVDQDAADKLAAETKHNVAIAAAFRTPKRK